jgi:hypothetical protein
MAKTQKTLTEQSFTSSPQLIVTQGIVQNLPEIIGAIRELYTLHKKTNTFQHVLQTRLEELNINKENFKVLVQSLTKLSKTAGADEETKTMYREMIQILFHKFVTNMQSSQDFSNYVKNL